MNLNYKSFGSGEPVIILHGLFGMLDNWQTFAKNLAENFRVIVPDQRNHGRSFHSDIFDYSVLARDINTFLLELNIPQTHIIGHSMGGKVAMQFSHLYPKKTASIVIVDIAPKPYLSVHHEIFKAILSINLSQYSQRKEIDQALSVWIHDSAIRNFLLKNLHRTSEGGFEWKADFKSLYKNYKAISDWNSNSASHTPALFVKGSMSNYIQKDDEDLIKKEFLNSQIVVVNSGHWVHAQKPTILLKIIKDFLHDNPIKRV